MNQERKTEVEKYFLMLSMERPSDRNSSEEYVFYTLTRAIMFLTTDQLKRINDFYRATDSFGTVIHDVQGIMAEDEFFVPKINDL